MSDKNRIHIPKVEWLALYTIQNLKEICEKMQTNRLICITILFLGIKITALQIPISFNSTEERAESFRQTSNLAQAHATSAGIEKHPSIALTNTTYSFLKECNHNNFTTKIDQALCSLYTEMQFAFKGNISSNIQDKIITSFNDPGFCDMFPTEVHVNSSNNISDLLKTEQFCELVCFDISGKIKPICKFIVWFNINSVKIGKLNTEAVSNKTISIPVTKVVDKDSKVDSIPLIENVLHNNNQGKDKNSVAEITHSPSTPKSTTINIIKETETSYDHLPYHKVDELIDDNIDEDHSSYYDEHNNGSSDNFKSPDTLDQSNNKLNDVTIKKENTFSDPFVEDTGSNFFTYFIIGTIIGILLYVLYHSKPKILALILEGRRSRTTRNGRRKHTATYRKLDTNLEEAMTSDVNCQRTQIIY